MYNAKNRIYFILHLHKLHIKFNMMCYSVIESLLHDNSVENVLFVVGERPFCTLKPSCV